MRRHLHRRRRFPSGKKNLDWVVGVYTQIGQQVFDNGVPAGQDGWTPLFSLLSTDDIVAQDKHCTVLRVVGDFTYGAHNIVNGVGTNLGQYAPYLEAGILVQPVDSAGDVLGINWDVGVSPDLELSWLWLKKGPAGDTPLIYSSIGGSAASPLGSATNEGGIFPIAYSFHLDLRVKRKLGEREELVFWARMLNSTNNFTFGSADAVLQWTWTAGMRCLVQQNPRHPAGAG